MPLKDMGVMAFDKAGLNLKYEKVSKLHEGIRNMLGSVRAEGAAVFLSAAPDPEGIVFYVVNDTQKTAPGLRYAENMLKVITHPEFKNDRMVKGKVTLEEAESQVNHCREQLKAKLEASLTGVRPVQEKRIYEVAAPVNPKHLPAEEAALLAKNRFINQAKKDGFRDAQNIVSFVEKLIQEEGGKHCQMQASQPAEQEMKKDVVYMCLHKSRNNGLMHIKISTISTVDQRINSYLFDNASYYKISQSQLRQEIRRKFTEWFPEKASTSGSSASASSSYRTPFPGGSRKHMPVKTLPQSPIAQAQTESIYELEAPVPEEGPHQALSAKKFAPLPPVPKPNPAPTKPPQSARLMFFHGLNDKFKARFRGKPNE